MKLLCLYAVIFAVSISAGYSAPLKWNKGSVVLANQKVIVGDIRVDEINDLILLRSDATVDVLPAYKISMVYVFDENENMNRKFISQRDENSIMTIYHLYEIVVQGEVSVWRKEKQLFPSAATNHALDYNYLIRIDEHLVTLQEFREKVFPELMNQAGDELKVFIKRRKLNINKAASALEIIRFYNQRGTMLAMK